MGDFADMALEQSIAEMVMDDDERMDFFHGDYTDMCQSLHTSIRRTLAGSGVEVVDATAAVHAALQRQPAKKGKRMQKLPVTNTGASGKLPLYVVIGGRTGIGKTTLASGWPKPFYILTEDGTRSIEALQLPSIDLSEISRRESPLDYIKRAVFTIRDSGAQTVVLDSGSALESWVISHLCKKHNKASLNSIMGGYGAGFSAMAEMMSDCIREVLSLRRDKGMQVVVICHRAIETFKPEDDDEYQIMTLRLDKRNKKLFMENADVVGFMRQVRSVEETDGGNRVAISSDERMLVCHTEASVMSKNRLGITEPLPITFGQNPLAPWIAKTMGDRPKQTNQQPAAEQPAAQPQPTPEPQQAAPASRTTTTRLEF